MSIITYSSLHILETSFLNSSTPAGTTDLPYHGNQTQKQPVSHYHHPYSLHLFFVIPRRLLHSASNPQLLDFTHPQHHSQLHAHCAVSLVFYTALHINWLLYLICVRFVLTLLNTVISLFVYIM